MLTLRKKPVIYDQKKKGKKKSENMPVIYDRYWVGGQGGVGDGRKSPPVGTSHEPLRVTRNGLMNKVTPSQPERDSIGQMPKEKEAGSVAK